jgi:hypothetical protein
MFLFSFEGAITFGFKATAGTILRRNVELGAANRRARDPEETWMKSAIVAGLVAMAFGAASSSTALAQAKKEASPGAVTSASAAKALPGGASQSGVVGQGVVVGQGGSAPSAAMPGNAGVVDSSVKGAEKARNN